MVTSWLGCHGIVNALSAVTEKGQRSIGTIQAKVTMKFLTIILLTSIICSLLAAQTDSSYILLSSGERVEGKVEMHHPFLGKPYLTLNTGLCRAANRNRWRCGSEKIQSKGLDFGERMHSLSTSRKLLHRNLRPARW